MPNEFQEAQQEHVKIQNMVKDTLKMDNGTEEKEEEVIINNTITAADSIKNRYGIRQQIITVNSNEDSYIKAMRTLTDNCKPVEDIEVECIGDLDYRVGFGVHVQIPFLSQYTDCLMYIKSVDHEWKPNGMFISKLVLTQSRVMDEQDWSDTTENSEDSDSYSIDSDLWNKIYLLLKQQIGKPYVYGASGPDSFDCSGLVQYCYNQYKSDTRITLLRTTYDQVKQGTKVDESNMDEWEPGDLVFPHAGHVVVYIGNGQCIEALQTGTNVMVHDYTRITTYAVRRILPEVTTDTASSISTTGSKNSKYASSNLIKYTEQNEGFKGNAYQNSSGWYIGYGTAYNTFPDAFNKGKSKSSTITQEQAEQYLIKYLDECGSQLNSLLATRQKSLPQNKIDALLDCMYIQGAYSLNAGSGRILLDAACGINTLISVEQAFINFVSVKGRAKANYNMFKNGVYKPYNS